MRVLNENLFILNGVLSTMAAPTAETGNAATAEALPEAKIDADGKVVTDSEKSQEAKDGKTEEATPTSSTGDTPATSSVTGGDGMGEASNNMETAGGDGAGAGAGAGMAGDAAMAGGEAGMDGMNGMNTEVGASGSITQSLPATIGVTAGVLALSILAGIVLAKLKIKKGINLYED